MIYARPHLLLWLIQPTCMKLVVGGRGRRYIIMLHTAGDGYIFSLYFAVQKGPRAHVKRIMETKTVEQNLQWSRSARVA